MFALHTSSENIHIRISERWAEGLARPDRGFAWRVMSDAIFFSGGGWRSSDRGGRVGGEAWRGGAGEVGVIQIISAPAQRETGGGHSSLGISFSGDFLGLPRRGLAWSRSST